MWQQSSLLEQLLPEPSPLRPYVHPADYKEVPNVRHYSDGMHKQYKPNLCTLVIAVVTLALYISIPHIMFSLFIGALFSRTALMAVLLLMSTLLIPAKPLRVPAVLSSYMFLCWRRYFKFSYLFEVSLDSYQDYIIAQFPHGAFPIGAVLGGTFMATTYPEYPCYALAANAAFWVPIWRQVHGWLGTEACTKANFHHLLGLGVKGPLAVKQRAASPASAPGSAHSMGSCCNRNSNSSSHLRGEQHGQKGQKAPGSTPFARGSAARLAAADGITAAPAGGAAVDGTASAALASHSMSGVLVGSAGSRVLQRPAGSAPLRERVSAALSLRSSLFKGSHTLSDTDSSESECESEAGQGGWETCCACGSGLRCKNPRRCAVQGCVLVNSDDGSPCGSSRSSSCSGASMCSCCGAVTVLAEVHSLPLDSTMFKQQEFVSTQADTSSHSLGVEATTAAVTDAAVEPKADTNGSTHAPQQLAPATASSPQHPTQQPLLVQQQQQQQRESEGGFSGRLSRHDQTNPSNWRVDPVTGARKLGASVALMVGGIAEMFMIRADHERIKLKDRKGFIRIALEHGVDVLPVYMFGVNQALDFGPPWLQRISRKMRASLGVIYGAWGLPIPRRVPIFMVTGRPIPVGVPMRKDDPAFPARVDELHATFCAEVERLYYTHRAKYGHGFENRPLVIS